MKKAKLCFKIFWCLTVVFCITAFMGVVYLNSYLPENFQIYEGDSLKVSCVVPLKTDLGKTKSSVPAQSTLKTAGENYKVNIKILGLIPVKTASVSVVEQNSVMVLGNPFGIKIYSNGVMVVGSTDVDTKNGLKNPAKNSGIKLGDIITLIDNLPVSSNNDIAEIIEQSNGNTLKFNIIRNGKSFTVKVRPLKSKTDNKYKIGIWVRDSSAGIGTFTFYNPKTKIVVGLGHAICDTDTGKIIPLNHGEMVDAEILTVTKGKLGTAGELKGVFKNKTLGKFLYNSQTGVYGKVANNIEFNGKFLKVANKQNITTGTAEILSTVDGSTPKSYKCKIEKVHFNDNSKTKNMIIKITDKNLLSKTGGIVQGMSGSPIIQNGKLIGAVTHVLVNDPTTGYGIFIENMLSLAS